MIHFPFVLTYALDENMTLLMFIYNLLDIKYSFLSVLFWFYAYFLQHLNVLSIKLQNILYYSFLLTKYIEVYIFC
jgi:hypothetical protein